MNLIIRLLYFLTFFGIGMVLLLSRKQQRNVRRAVDAFAMAFVRISNKVASHPLDKSDLSQACMQSVMTRASDAKAAELYQQLLTANENVTAACGRSARLRHQFAEPVQNLFDTARHFLIYCEHKGKNSDPLLLDAFHSFLLEQKTLRHELFKRISRQAGEEFLALSVGYDVVRVPSDLTQKPVG